RSKLTVLSDGSVGLSPGTEVSLIGPGSPIPTLTFAFNAGEVTNFDSVAAQISTIPAPSSLILTGIGLLGVAFVARGQNRRCPNAFSGRDSDERGTHLRSTSRHPEVFGRTGRPR